MCSLKSESAGQSVVCPTCGKQLPAEAKFCGFDGTALGGNADRAVHPQHGNRATALDTLNRVCPQCSTVYPGYAMFCSVDAAKLVNVGEAKDQPAATQLWDDHYTTAAPDADDQIPSSELIGHTIGGRYRLEEFIGEGGMAFVYRATHVTIEKPVVIKILQGRLLANEKSVQRFERECKVTAKISHPNVVSVFDVGLINSNQPYLVME
ncbi:MAG: zinc ribbon domain-containing protein, partial [Candidatus Melainabacteria bacterium]|nr:zinc ribbon domain-containing protein [Candidatus Melainabacteria bacterium]